MTVIYGLIDPRDLCLRYVGKSKNPIKRLRSHLKEEGDTRKCRWLGQLKSLGLMPNLVILENCEDVDWQASEAKWISFFRRPEWSGDRLCNHTNGGEGLINPSIETRQKLSHLQTQRMKDLIHRQKVFTTERNEKISKSLTGLKKTERHVLNLPQNQKGFKPKLTEKRRRQLSEQIRSQNASRKYQSLSEETKKRISEKSKGNRSRSGLTNSSDMNSKISNSLKGKQKSPEHREKMKLAAQKRWAEKRNKSNDEFS